MQISEFSFPHLHAAHDGRLAVELERQRIAAERRADGAAAAPSAAAARGVRAAVARLRPAAEAPTRAAEPCLACP
jgi:hypothetical protein